MNIKENFLELKRAWIDAKGNSALRAQIDFETDAFFDSLTDIQKKEVIQTTKEDFEAMHREIADINQAINIRNKLAPVLPAISVSYLAKNYFRKTPQWFYQRMNGNKVNGKSAAFSDSEIQILNFAIQDISTQLSAVRF